MPTVITLLLCGARVVGALMTTLWLPGIRHRNFSYVDIGWSADFAVLALVHGLRGDGASARRLLRAPLAADDKSCPDARRRTARGSLPLKASAVAINSADANAQHYELPSELVTLVLGSHLKYSCCYARLDGTAQATRGWVCWRVFFMACAERWGSRRGRGWLVLHDGLVKPAVP